MKQQTESSIIIILWSDFFTGFLIIKTFLKVGNAVCTFPLTLAISFANNKNITDSVIL